MSIDDEIKAIVRAELAAALPVAIREAFGAVFQADRRVAPRATRKRERATAKRTCPVAGCGNAFSPRFGGFCADHRDTAAFKAWAKAPKRKRATGGKKR
jgi:hypothetical protein